MITAKIASIEVVFSDYPDPNMFALGVAFVGCDFKCYKCQNPELQSGSYMAKEYTPYDLNDEIKIRSAGMDMGIVLYGGDPFSEDNRAFTKEFLELNRRSVAIFTGYELQQLYNIPDCKSVMETRHFDYLKTGQYKHKIRRKPELTDEYMQLASENQKLYDRGLNLLTNKYGRYIFKNHLGDKD